MEALEKIKILRQNANSIIELFNVKIPKWESDKKHYDKVGWGFNQDDRFNAHKPFSISFDSHMGVYGDSSCSRQCSLDNDIFMRHFLKYLNSHRKQIMLGVAESIQNEALSLKAKAEAELQSQLQMLVQLEESEKLNQ